MRRFCPAGAHGALPGGVCGGARGAGSPHVSLAARAAPASPARHERRVSRRAATVPSPGHVAGPLACPLPAQRACCLTLTPSGRPATLKPTARPPTPRRSMVCAYTGTVVGFARGVTQSLLITVQLGSCLVQRGACAAAVAGACSIPVPPARACWQCSSNVCLLPAMPALLCMLHPSCVLRDLLTPAARDAALQAPLWPAPWPAARSGARQRQGGWRRRWC